MKAFALLIATFILLSGCYDKNTMPEAIEEIVELSQHSPEHLNLILEIENIESDSLMVNIFLDNSDTTTADTLYHSSSFPLHVAYINEKYLTPSMNDQVFFSDINSTVVRANSKKLISSFQVKKLSSTSYKMITLFRYTQHHPDNNSKHLWLASDPVKIK